MAVRTGSELQQLSPQSSSRTFHHPQGNLTPPQPLATVTLLSVSTDLSLLEVSSKRRPALRDLPRQAPFTSEDIFGVYPRCSLRPCHLSLCLRKVASCGQTPLLVRSRGVGFACGHVWTVVTAAADTHTQGFVCTEVSVLLEIPGRGLPGTVCFGGTPPHTHTVPASSHRALRLQVLRGSLSTRLWESVCVAVCEPHVSRAGVGGRAHPAPRPGDEDIQ